MKWLVSGIFGVEQISRVSRQNSQSIDTYVKEWKILRDMIWEEACVMLFLGLVCQLSEWDSGVGNFAIALFSIISSYLWIQINTNTNFILRVQSRCFFSSHLYLTNLYVFIDLIYFLTSRVLFRLRQLPKWSIYFCNICQLYVRYKHIDLNKVVCLF